MSAARVFEQMTKLVKDGRVSEEVACKVLEAAGVVFTCGSKQGTFCKGMLKVGEGVITLDPSSISDFNMPEPEPDPEPEPEPETYSPPAYRVPASKPDVVDSDS